MPHHPHHETGISDEAAMEAHDIIDRAEEEEHQLHAHTSNESTTQAQMGDAGKTMPTSGMPASGSPTEHHKSGFEKMKEKLHMKK